MDYYQETYKAVEKIDNHVRDTEIDLPEMVKDCLALTSVRMVSHIKDFSEAKKMQQFYLILVGNIYKAGYKNGRNSLLITQNKD